jgi:tetratricopeptide (TPR) repeat protein
MKKFRIFDWGLLIFWGLTLVVSADELVLRDGQKISGTVLKTDGKTVTIRIPAGGGQAEIPYPLNNIRSLTFEKNPEIEALLKSSNPGDLPKLQVWWEKRLPYLKLFGSNTGDIGLGTIRLLLSRQTKKAAGEALILARQIEESDWSGPRKNEATRLRLSALAASGKAEQAMAEAEKLEDVSGLDEMSLASARVQARLVQGELALKKLGELEKDWPKWEQMTDKSREHRELLNKALDGFLFPVVFHPELKQAAAEGLYQAAEIHLKRNDTTSALIYAHEIVDYYPEGEFKIKAEKLIKENKTPATKKTT